MYAAPSGKDGFTASTSPAGDGRSVFHAAPGVDSFTTTPGGGTTSSMPIEVMS